MRSHLERRGCDATTIDEAIVVLEAQGYLNDARYARLFVEDKRGLEQWGTQRIAQTLRRRGIDRELVEQSLAETEGGSEIDRALALLRRRFPAAPREHRERERALGVLVRKGYEVEVALDAIAAYTHCADPSPVLRCP
jgi:regulatory protein